MARGDHPQRTPVYGAGLIVLALLAGLSVQTWFSPPTVVQFAVLALALIMALVGFVMTLRDLTPPRR